MAVGAAWAGWAQGVHLALKPMGSKCSKNQECMHAVGVNEGNTQMIGDRLFAIGCLVQGWLGWTEVVAKGGGGSSNIRCCSCR